MIDALGAFERLGSYLWSFSWEVAILILIVAIADRLMRRYSSGFRYLLWMVVLVRLAVPVSVILPVPVPSWLKSAPVIQPVEPAVDLSLPGLERELAGGEEIVSYRTTPIQPEVSKPILPPLSYAGYFGLVCSVCAAIILLVIAIRWLVMWHSLRNYIRIRRNEIHNVLKKLLRVIGLRRRVSTYAWDTETSGTVALAGIVHPRIYLPRNMAETWPTNELEPVLLHELAHVKRADLAVNWLQVILQALYFFHPLVWYANRRIRRLREEACDDLAVAALNGSRKRYVASMLRVLEETTRIPTFGFAAMGFSERRSGIGERIRRIMDAKTRFSSRMTVRSAFALISIAMLSVLVSCGVSSLWRAEATEAKKSEIPDELILRGIIGETQRDTVVNMLSSDDLDISLTVAAVKTSDDNTDGELIRAVTNMVKEVNRHTGLNVSVKELTLGDPALQNCPVAFMLDAPAQRNISTKEIENLRTYLANGGFLFGEWSDIEEEFGEQQARVKQLFTDTLGHDTLILPIPHNHSLYHCFFEFGAGPPAVIRRDTVLEVPKNLYIEGIFVGSSLVAAVSQQGYISSWNDLPAELQLRFGVNIVVFAALREGGMLTREAHITVNDPVIVMRPPVSELIFRERSSAADTESRTKGIDIEISDETTYRVNGETITKENLEETLKNFNLADPGIDINIEYRDEYSDSAANLENILQRLSKSSVESGIPSDTIEIEILDDENYRIDGKTIPKTGLEQALKQNFDSDHTSSVTITGSSGLASFGSEFEDISDGKAAAFVVDMARKLGFETIIVEETMPRKTVYISIVNNSYYRIGFGMVARDELEKALRIANSDERLFIVSHSTEDEAYHDAFLFLEGVLERIGADYRIAELKPVQTGNANKLEERFGTKQKMEPLNIEILDETTYCVFDLEVSADDLERVLKEHMDPDVSYMARLGGRYDVSAMAFNNATSMVMKLGVGGISYRGWEGEDSGEKLPPLVTNTPGGEHEDLVIEIVDDQTYKVFGVQVTRESLEHEIRENINPEIPYTVVIKGVSTQPMEMYLYAQYVASNVGLKGWRTLMTK